MIVRAGTIEIACPLTADRDRAPEQLTLGLVEEIDIDPPAAREM